MSSLPPEPIAPYGGAYDCGVSVRRTLPSAQHDDEWATETNYLDV